MAQTEVLYKIEKHEIRKAADRYLLENYPGARSNLTKRLIAETRIYLEGYAKAIAQEVQDPIIIDDMKNLLLMEGVEYIVKQIG